MPTAASGRYFLQVPGPTIIPDRVAAAMAMPALDHRGPVFSGMAARISNDLKAVFKTRQPVMIFPSSGTGAWQAAIVNTLSAGDKVLIFETGHFSYLWKTIAIDLGLDVIEISGDWRSGIDANAIEAHLKADERREIKAVLAVHNETATGVTSDIQALRRAMDNAGHDALLFVDTISSLCAIDYAHDVWGVDVTICGSQKGFMLPPGLSFTVASEKALERCKTSNLPKGYFRWEPMIEAAANGLYPYTPPVTLFYGLRESLAMLQEEGLEHVFARHAKLAAATRAAVAAWGFEIQCRKPAEYSSAVTAVRLPEGHDADAYRAIVLEKFDMSLAAGLGKIAGRVFRIGHLGYMNALTLAGALSGVEMGFEAANIPFERGGVLAAMEVLNQG